MTTKQRNVVFLYDRLAFCSRECIAAALEEHTGHEENILKRSIPDELQRVIMCYGCGLHVDEA